MNFHRRKKSIVEVSLTPMIDVVFLLLIFFMVTTTFNEQTELKINLPTAQGEELTEQKTLDLTIDANGTYFVNKKQLVNNRMITLKKAIIQATGSNRKVPFIISADANTPHQSVISALDSARQLGFVHVGFATINPAALAQ